VVEIHWAIWKKGLSVTVRRADIWERVCSAELLEKPVLTFSLEDTLIISCIHGTKHMWHTLGWISDVAELVRAHHAIDWGELLARSRSLGTEKMRILGLRLANTLLQAPLPEKVKRTHERESAMKSLAAQIEKSLRH
jgi:hypothetical protein